MRNILLAGVAVVLFAIGTNRARAISFTTFDYPASSTTFLFGVSGSTIVGDTGAAVGGDGFVYDGTNFSKIQINEGFPNGNVDGAIYGVNGSSFMGSYFDEGETFGFVKSGSTTQGLTNTTGPSGLNFNTYAHGVDQGIVVGYSTDFTGTEHEAFSYNGTTYTTADYEIFDQTEQQFLKVPSDALGISGSNIVGRILGSTMHGYEKNGMTYTELDFPGSSSTEAWGIDGNNIVGNYTLGGVVHGFLYDGTNWTSIDYPGASDTFATGIDGDTIVGYYNDRGARVHCNRAVAGQRGAGDSWVGGCNDRRRQQTKKVCAGWRIGFIDSACGSRRPGRLL